MSNAIVILGFAVIIGYLVMLQVKHWTPFNFSSLAGNAAPTSNPISFNNEVATETGAGVSRTLFAKGMAVVLALFLVNTLWVLAWDMKDKGDWDPNQTGPNFPPGVVVR